MRALIDAGTTRTRLRVVAGQQVLWAGERPVGARDVASSGSNQVLRTAVAALLAEARLRVQVHELVCSGMITSNVGLLEVPHLRAPAGLAELARAVRRADFEEFAAPCYFIPGVKTLPGELSWDTLGQADLLRGEEVEVLGLRELLDLQAASFLHLGSHSKRIEVDGHGRLTGSRTVLSGELAATVAEHTVLSGSVLPTQSWADLPPEGWHRGLAAARQHGLGQALFMVRLGQVLLEASRHELSAYLLGAVSLLTLELLTPPGRGPLIVYGPLPLAGWLADQARVLGWPDVRVADPPLTVQAAVLGTQRIMERRESELAPAS